MGRDATTATTTLRATTHAGTTFVTPITGAGAAFKKNAHYISRNIPCNHSIHTVIPPF
jgi:hypothetical protein